MIRRACPCDARAQLFPRTTLCAFRSVGRAVAVSLLLFFSSSLLLFFSLPPASLVHAHALSLPVLCRLCLHLLPVLGVVVSWKLCRRTGSLSSGVRISTRQSQSLGPPHLHSRWPCRRLPELIRSSRVHSTRRRPSTSAHGGGSLALSLLSPARVLCLRSPALPRRRGQGGPNPNPNPNPDPFTRTLAQTRTWWLT